MDRITLEDELNKLELLHRKLDEKIKQGYTNYLDDQSLGMMKQEKLSVKRSIEAIKNQLIRS